MILIPANVNIRKIDCNAVRGLNVLFHNLFNFSYDGLEEYQAKRLDCGHVEACTDLQLKLYRSYYLCNAMPCMPVKICLSPDT